MLGEAAPEIAPELHARVCELMKFGLAWVREADQWLGEASIAMTNVLAFRPPGNKITELCVNKKEALALDSSYALPAIEPPGNYLRPEFLPELARLGQEITEINPNLIVACGAKATWALLGATNIGSIRGAITRSATGHKLLPTYHPAGVMRQWSWRPIVVADLMKAFREAKFPDIRRPSRQITYNPTLTECQQFVQRLLAKPPALMGCDTETAIGQVSMISFAPSRDEALIIPFMDERKRSYWATAGEELAAWDCVGALLESPIVKVWQNGVYDFQYLMPMGFRLVNCLEDSMLLHHSIYPEMRKGLGFLGSIYTREPSWKLMRTEKADTEKRDE